jgi:hypothetical protein
VGLGFAVGGEILVFGALGGVRVVVFREDALEEPGGGAPVGSRGVFHQPQGIGGRLEGEAHFVIKIFVASTLALDGAD